jgi:hypothetical protein
MTLLNQIDHYEPTLTKMRVDPNEFVRMECGRLIHAAVINKRFLDMLLKNPVKSIEQGYCGEKFIFTHEEKQRIQTIHASNLADFSNQLLQVMEEVPASIPAAPQMAYLQ